LINRQTIPNLLRSALTTAMGTPIDAATRQALHARRSRAWVAALADAFRGHYRDDPDVRVLSKHDPSNQREFGLNELLYDVLVCRVGTTPAATKPATLTYVREALWQVESEFARDSRQAIYDLNKLVLGAARQKLFVGPQVSDEAGFLAALLPVARCCSGEVYMALAPHPAQWDACKAVVRVWRLVDGELAGVP